MRLANLALLPLLAGCATLPQPACPAGETRAEVATLVFGRNIGQEIGVSEADFSRFLDEEVSPRFPDGLTIQDTRGHWLFKGVVYNEPGKMVTIVLRGRPGDRQKIGEVARAYETRHRQDAVLSMVRPACVSFWLAKPQ